MNMNTNSDIELALEKNLAMSHDRRLNAFTVWQSLFSSVIALEKNDLGGARMSRMIDRQLSASHILKVIYPHLDTTQITHIDYPTTIRDHLRTLIKGYKRESEIPHNSYQPDSNNYAHKVDFLADKYDGPESPTASFHTYLGGDD